MVFQRRLEPLLGHLRWRHSLHLAQLHARCVVLELAIDAAPETYLIVHRVQRVMRAKVKLMILVR